ncbi:MAG: hypothetical protein Q9159_007322 [Coniocarpon cinnabarinum]
MGHTPRPFSLPQQHVTPLGSTLVHSRSQSDPQTSTAANIDVATVSETMLNAQLNARAPIHRTDFLLRRGSVQTGYEDKVKPSWSKRSKHPSFSLRRLTLADRSVTAPVFSTSQSPESRHSRLTPLFSTPLRFGLPLSPSPGRNKSPIPPARPPRSDENLAKLVKLEGRSVHTGEAKRISNDPPPPKRAKKMRVRDRSESARRPLVRNIDGVSRGNSTDRSAEGQASSLSLERHDSDASATTIESDSTFESAESAESEQRGRGTNISTETINVLLPPPSLFQTPPPPSVITPKRQEPRAAVDPEMIELRRETTFEEMMKRAGWRRSDWQKH